MLSLARPRHDFTSYKKKCIYIKVFKLFVINYDELYYEQTTDYMHNPQIFN